MPVSCELQLEAVKAAGEWQTAHHAHVTIHAFKEARTAEDIRQAEQLFEALRRLLKSEEESPAATETIYLIGPFDQAEVVAHRGAERMVQEAGLPMGPTDRDPIIHAAGPGAPGDPLSVALTRGLIVQWFGTQAASASLFVEGIAGYVAASLGMGPSVDEQNRRVRTTVEAGKPVHLAIRNDAREHSRPGSASAAFDSAATSFVAFLISHSGESALRKYLGSYDPDRQDQAAITAYHHPIAVLEEEWLATIRRRPSDAHMFRSFLSQVMPLLRPYRWKQAEILCYLLLAAGYNIVQPYAIKVFIDRLTAHVQFVPAGAQAVPLFVRTLGPFLLLLLGIYTLNGVVSLRRAYAVNWLNQNVLNTLQVRMYAHLQRLAHNFYLNARVGDLMARLSDDLDSVQSALAQITNKALYQGFTAVGGLTALFMLTRKSPIMAVPILCILPLFAVYYAALRSRNKQASREQRRRVGQAMADVQQHLSAHAVIKAFGLEERTISDYRSRVLGLQRSKLRLALLSALTDLSEDSTTALAQLIIFGMGGYLVLRSGGREMGVGDLSALLVLVKSIFSPVASLAGIGQTIQQATGAMERVTELFNEPVTIADRPNACKLEPLSQEIRLDDVTFRYGGQRPALDRVSLAIPAGAHVAIVGLSGGGKSSIVNLLLRFWDPEEGQVLFDGHDVRDVTLSSLRGQIGLVFQETFLFDTTLRENIAVGRPDATDVEIAEAAKAAQLDRFIATLPAGYDTIPGENGARLSVGQKQRIAIARTFLRNPRILILDEATSALDAQTEAGVLETLGELAKGRTTISVTHRISQAVNADLIFVMDGGRLVEQGSHDSLMESGGLYSRLYRGSDHGG